jgi:GNAT superfamily N-acetyltransferase
MDKVYLEFHMGKNTIRFAVKGDEPWFRINDELLREDLILRKISAREVLLAEVNGVLIGMLRFSYLWDSIPFMNLLFIIEEYRERGIGRDLVNYWEEIMKVDGYKYVMTSTQADETAQHFYRKIGYRDCGSMLYPGQNPLELFLIKQLS